MTQCAAVRIQEGEMMAPPQRWDTPTLRLTCQGGACCSPEALLEFSPLPQSEEERAVREDTFTAAGVPQNLYSISITDTVVYNKTSKALVSAMYICICHPLHVLYDLCTGILETVITYQCNATSPRCCWDRFCCSWQKKEDI